MIEFVNEKKGNCPKRRRKTKFDNFTVKMKPPSKVIDTK